MSLASFCLQPTPQVARQLLGWKLTHHLPEGTVSGIISETEAYLADDPASHSFNGRTPRNQAMFGEPGTAYIYRIYGVHLCFNLVTQPPDIAEAVLIRAVIPCEGKEHLAANRHRPLQDPHLTDGPGKLAQAFNLQLAQNGHYLENLPLTLSPAFHFSDDQVQSTPRIGIRKAVEAPLRFTPTPQDLAKLIALC